MTATPVYSDAIEMLYELLGRWLFPRQPVWERRKNAKTTVFTLGFTLTVGYILAEVIRLMYYHQK